MTLENIAQLFMTLGKDPHLLIGEPEQQWLDFKAEPHLVPQRTSDHHRFEFAKDVVAMANSGGGVLLFGVATIKRESEHHEVAQELRAIPQSAFDPQQARAVLRDWVFPTVVVDINSHEVSGAQGKLWSLHVHPQSEGALPFVVTKAFVSTSENASRVAFAVYRRDGTDNAAISPQELHRWMHLGRSGIVFQPTQTMGREHAVTPTTQASGAFVAHVEEGNEALDAEVGALEVEENELFYFVQIWPDGGEMLHNFFGGGQNALQEAMFRFEQVRPSGFGLPRHVSVERTGQNGLRMGWRGIRGVSVAPSGLSTFVCGEHTLAWATENNAPKGDIYINPLALPEFTLEACRFFLKEVLPRRPRGHAGEGFLWRVGMRGLDPRVRLPRGRYGDIPARFFADHPGNQYNSATNFTSPWTRSNERAPDRLAFSILERVYHAFAYGPEVIPFAGEGRILEESIRSLRR